MDKTKSVLARLKNKSKSSGVGYQQLLQLLCQEEFLRRLSKSEYKRNLVLKGGLFIYILSDFQSRATIDMDFLLKDYSNDMDEITDLVSSIINVHTENEYITYEIKGVEQITVDKKYPGISVHMIGKIGNTKTPVNVDFGVGDIIVPESEVRLMKTQLDDFERVEVDTYSLESTVAEKFDAVVQRLALTSRMKDFYDLWYIASEFDFEGSVLRDAVRNTLENRGTPIEADSFERVIGLEGNRVTQTRWRAFCKKQKVDLELSKAIEMIDMFLHDVVNAIISGNSFEKKWVSDEHGWKEE